MSLNGLFINCPQSKRSLQGLTVSHTAPTHACLWLSHVPQLHVTGEKAQLWRYTEVSPLMCEPRKKGSLACERGCIVRLVQSLAVFSLYWT